MTDLILCLVILLFLAWILVLKAEMADLKTEIERLKELLKNKLGRMKDEVSISQGLRLKS
jgi:hypothetical protein